ncbi:hypothetical protein F4827_006791 [Paraburkholderia bannensis]|uniref:Uncharacterized protein n=1 Tax=Paraburkholderia bannensis TaxID=765414 RepID=A0A7W9U4L0_9BURK|nr:MULTISPECIES: hypothetical protein [Paraburkholderia]MBB3261917.1 hypothetical protein [Paraburkholderia sp. WP4_3_2]MBB6106912.1 hypothetical protein [Paraburkholderia bannensis]
MSARVDLSAVQNAYGLCYVRTPWAWFTRIALDRQWGERWEHAPYMRESGLPYADEPDQILKLGFDGPLLGPEEGAHAHSYSVQEINARKTAWLRSENYFGGVPIHIMSGVTIQRFTELVELAGGMVYAPLGWGQLPTLRLKSDTTS